MLIQYVVSISCGQMIIMESNRYAQQYVTNHEEYLINHPKSRVHEFCRRPFILSDFYNVLAIVITMGIVNLPRMSGYWTTTWPFSNNFSKIISRNRFLLFSKFLHFANNKLLNPHGQPAYDHLFKIRPVINRLISNFKSSYIPDKNLSIDESMISYKGRLAFLQYLPKKPHKWGMKAWVLAESKTGYTWNWDLYTGKVDHQDNDLYL